MPLFMDVHTIEEGVSAKEVADAHARDVEVQGQYGVNYKNYWVDEKAGKVFCLATGPSKEAVMRIHERAGHPTPQVYEITAEV